jgi:hypothetical protein
MQTNNKISASESLTVLVWLDSQHGPDAEIPVRDLEEASSIAQGYFEQRADDLSALLVVDGDGLLLAKAECGVEAASWECSQLVAVRPPRRGTRSA